MEMDPDQEGMQKKRFCIAYTLNSQWNLLYLPVKAGLALDVAVVPVGAGDEVVGVEACGEDVRTRGILCTG